MSRDSLISPTTVGGLLRRAAAESPDRAALVFPDVRQTYSQLQASVDTWARRLLGLQVRPGEHVGLLMTNRPEFVQLLFAACSIGAVIVPFNPRYRASELAHVIENSDVAVLVVASPPGETVDLTDRLVEALPSLAVVPEHQIAEAPRLRHVVSLDLSTSARTLSVDQVDARQQTITDAELDERYARTMVRAPAMIMYTSGTTAHPKGAVMSHEAMTRTAVALADGVYHLTSDDRMWDPLPLFHMSGVLPLLASVHAQCPYLCMYRVDATEGLRMMREEKATVAFVAFAQLAMDLIGQPEYRPADLETLRIVHTSGLPEVQAKVQDAFPQAIAVNPYGCTEAGGMCATSELTDTDEQRRNFSGRPYRGLEIRVVDPDNQPRPAGTVGEIVVRGYALFDGYYRNPEATRAVVDEEGWFHTGDLGELDADGRVRYVSRLKDMLKVGGENVACVEIENLLCSHPQVAIAAVVGQPHERLAEVPFAFVERTPGATLSEPELIEYCQGRIASFKVPAGIRFVTEWPMSATKIQKHRLREQLLDERSTP